MSKKQITEEMNVHKEWYVQAEKQTIYSLPGFIHDLLGQYSHDYGTICHAIAAGALATVNVMNRHPNAGITGFQSGCVMWEFLRHWNYTGNKCGLRILDYDKLMYPQYADTFEKTISLEVWEELQKQAKKSLIESKGKAHPDVLVHWLSIIDGVVPFGFTVK